LHDVFLSASALAVLCIRTHYRQTANGREKTCSHHANARFDDKKEDQTKDTKIQSIYIIHCAFISCSNF
jgi:hypothetical protein